ncbi:MAG: glucose-1-phosphate adenylyltransferase subunit GlgD [Lachnospiraceae bacterium]|nr:glucose-1-phosphate adenylyltransferase subunit GlgD [Lachnospiraceae bacterium]
MVNSNTSALGIIFPNNYDEFIPELVSVRMMASIPFASRYRLIDFTLSGMVNCGINNISIVANKNYQSLMDHLGSGREWDLVRKNGGLHLIPPFAEKDAKAYSGRVDALYNLRGFLKRQKEKYVILSASNVVANFDYSAMIENHAASGADITVAYRPQEIPEGYKNEQDDSKGFYYTFRIDNGRITKIFVNSKDDGIQDVSLSIFVIERELLIKLVEEATKLGQRYFERDVLLPQLDKLNIQAYKYDGYIAYITSMKSYFDENMKLLDERNLDALFESAPVYTKVRDDNPTAYLEGSRASNVMVADGCMIEGEIENSILFRGVKVGKGAKVKNCILMQDTVIEPGADVEYAITDKQVTITAGKQLKGTDTFPVYIAKFQTV